MSKSNRNLQYWDYLDDAQDTLEPVDQLSPQYSKHHILLPKSVDPNIFCATWDILVEDDEKYDLLTSSPKGSHSLRGDIQHACAHDPYLPRPLGFGHSHYCKFGLANPDSASEHRHTIPDNDTSLPIQGDNLNTYSMRTTTIFRHTAKINNLYKLK